MKPYNEELEFLVEQVRFRYRDTWWRGAGYLTWKPESGYRVHAPLEVDRLARGRSIGGGGLVRRRDRGSVRMRLRHSRIWALVPDAILKDRIDVDISHVLDLRVGRMVFSEPAELTDRDVWTGNCLISLTGKPLMPDTVERQVKLGGEDFHEGWSATGIHYESPEGERVIGMLGEHGRLQLFYRLPSARWSRVDAWCWAEAAREALGMILGQSPRLLEKSVMRHRHKYIDRRMDGAVKSVRPLALVGSDPIVDRDVFIRLTTFLTRPSTNRDVAVGLYRQFIAAGTQQSWQATELLMATALEGALRTWAQHPFRAGDQSFNWSRTFRAFISHLFPEPEWKGRIEDVKRSYFYLRDRNAHPDWLYETTGITHDDEREKAYRALQLLGQFYGYVILRLAGEPSVEPEFVNC